MNKYKLTVAIPTYSRKPFLKLTIDNFVKQIEEIGGDVCLLISDNGSLDGTVEMVQEYQKKYDFVFLQQNSDNAGFPGNFISILRSVETEYMWLMGDDDYVEQGGLARIYREIQEEPCDIYNINRVKCDSELNKVSSDRYYKKDIDQVFNIDNHNIGSVYDFFDAIRTFDGMFCFISSLVINIKTVKNMFKYSEHENINPVNYFPHVYLIFKSMSFLRTSKIKYIAEPLVHWRGDNTSKYESSYYTRIFVNYLHLAEVAQKLKHDNMLYAESILRIVRSKFKIRNFIVLGYHSEDPVDFRYYMSICRALETGPIRRMIKVAAYQTGRLSLFRFVYNKFVKK